MMFEFLKAIGLGLFDMFSFGSVEYTYHRSDEEAIRSDFEMVMKDFDKVVTESVTNSKDEA